MSALGTALEFSSNLNWIVRMRSKRMPILTTRRVILEPTHAFIVLTFLNSSNFLIFHYGWNVSSIFWGILVYTGGVIFGLLGVVIAFSSVRTVFLARRSVSLSVRYWSLLNVLLGAVALGMALIYGIFIVAILSLLMGAVSILPLMQRPSIL